MHPVWRTRIAEVVPLFHTEIPHDDHHPCAENLLVVVLLHDALAWTRTENRVDDMMMT
jgi:hypothetical protein